MTGSSRLVRGALASLLLACLVVGLGPVVAGAAGGDTTRINLSSTGEQATNDSWYASVSADGRYVAFTSRAANLVAGDTNNEEDIFVRDRVTGTTTRVSVGPGGVQSNDRSDDARISADGRYVVFDSKATNLVVGDTLGTTDVFVHDRATGVTTRESVSSAGAQGNTTSERPAISGDGRYVVFQSDATNLVDGDDNGQQDIFLRDRTLGTTTRISVRTVEFLGHLIDIQATGSSAWPAISRDGRYATFYSTASNLVANDHNAQADVFVRDIGIRSPDSTSRVSVGSGNVEATGGGSTHASISADGRFVAFESVATNLVTGDTNAQRDIFLRDRSAGTTIRVSVGAAGAQANDGSWTPSVSGDGRFVAFESPATNLRSPDTNGKQDIFVYDRIAGSTTMASVSSAGVQATTDSASAAMSSDGRYVAFECGADNIIPGDNNLAWDIMLHQLTSEPVLLSLSAPSPKWGAPAAVTVALKESTPPNVPLPGRTVILQKLVSGTWKDIGSLATGADGMALFGPALSTKSSFRARFDAVPAKLDAGVSPTLSIAPKVALGTPVARKTMKRSKYYTVYGSLKPRHKSGTKPVRIYKYKKVNGKWKSYGYVKAKAYNYKTYSRYKVRMRLTSKGSWRLRAYAPADSKHAKTWSAKYDYVTVK